MFEWGAERGKGERACVRERSGLLVCLLVVWVVGHCDAFIMI